MNRRVLLIDADPLFRDTLTRELSRYEIVVEAETDAERALTLATADAPALILLTIEEADKKSGFRVFEKCKKGALSGVPIILVTGSVPPESFAKHRSLKVHADEYIDKRSMSTHELVGKIDGLIGLVEAAEGLGDDEELAIPLEDEIPMEIADGDVVLDEVIGDDLDAHADQPALLAHEPPPDDGAGTTAAYVPDAPDVHDEFDASEGRTLSGDGLTVDSVVEAETDAAFDALMGGLGGPGGPDEPSLQMIAEQGEHREQSVTIPPIEPESHPVDEALAADALPVPEPIHEGRGRGTTPPPILDSVPAIILDSPRGHAELDDRGAGRVAYHDGYAPDEEAAIAQVHEERAEEIDRADTTMAGADLYAADAEVVEDDRPESGAAMLIEEEELVAIDDELPVEVEIEEPDPYATAARTQQIPHAPTVGEDAPRGRPGSNTSNLSNLSNPSNPSGLLASSTAGGTGSHPAIDLGLDVVAEDARSEQSGAYDRRALRKIGELERQLAQLKLELERARATGDTAAKGSRETQFLHLRESMLAKDKELKQVKTDLADRDAELAEASELLANAERARAALDAKHGELEQRATQEAARTQRLAIAHEASSSEASQLQQALDRADQATAAAEAARAQLERELASERMTGKASASEAERRLRTEREQLAQRHHEELAAARAASDEAQVTALARLRDELEDAHGRELEQQIDALRRATAQEHAAATAALENQHASAASALETYHANERSRLHAELGGQIGQLQAALAEAKSTHEDAITAVMGTHASALEQQADAHADALARQAADHRVAVEQRDRAQAAALADKDRAHQALFTETTKAAAAAAMDRDRMLDQLRREHAAALSERDQASHQALDHAIEQLRREHAAAFAEQDRAHAQRLAEQKRAQDATLAAKQREAEDQAVTQAATLADVRSELDRARAAHEGSLADARRAADEAAANHEAVRDQHRAKLEELESSHTQALAQLSDTARRAAEGHRAALADATSSHRTALADATSSHRAALADAATAHAAELRQVNDAAGREVARLETAAAAALRAAEDASAKHAAERDTATKGHARQLSDAEARRERELSIANTEHLKQRSAADAEHARAMASVQADAERARTQLVADHDRVVRDLSGERDELERGLSSARDSLKRSEAELASAVQSIADRNAELRQHTAAIAERDTRIAELRQEIEALEAENTSYQEQVLRAYQKIKTDEATVARARKAMAIALTVLDDQGSPKET